MATFVHIADERDAKAIRKSGLALPRARFREQETEVRKWGVFAMPVIGDFMLSHQWVRELKRRGFRVAVGVYFRLDDEVMVWAGMYNEAKSQMKAVEAAKKLSAERRLGFEVIIPCAISASAIVAIRALPSVGWRYFPEAKGNPPRCLCKYCVGRDIKSRRMRERLDPEGNYA